MNIKQYFKKIQEQVDENYQIASKGREKGMDPVSSVEIPLVKNLAEKVVGLISSIYPQVNDKKIVDRISALEKEYGLSDFAVAFKIAEEISKEKFCKFKDKKEAIDAGIRIGFSYITFGAVSSPLEGYTHWETKKTKEGKDYMCLYYSGPVRSAGGTNGTLSVLIADHIREVLGYEIYDPTEEEIKRTVSEVFDYHERINNLQYVPSERELEFLARRVPVQINGLPSESKEVYNYKDLPRVETNFIRNGVALILGEGLAQKAHKILKILRSLRKKGISLSDWDWLEEFVELKNKEQETKKKGEASATYISDIVAGRPVLGHPGKGGGFRLRYGRCRTSGLSSMAMSPLTMSILKDYIAQGTQLKYEGPGKSSAMSLCDEIEGPIVKLEGGDAVKIDSLEKSVKYKNQIQEVLFLGDFLVNYAEFFNRGKHFEKPGYCEEWYSLELERGMKAKGVGGNLKYIADQQSLSADLCCSADSPPTNENRRIKLVEYIAEKIVRNWRTDISFEDAAALSDEYKVALHPKFIFYWTQITGENFFDLFDWISHGEIGGGKLVLPWTRTDQSRFGKGKRALELIGCEHGVSLENVFLSVEKTNALLFNLGFDEGVKKDFDKTIDYLSAKIKTLQEEDALKIVNHLCRAEIRDKAGTFIGARMGRPEKAKLRKLTGSPHVLFPVGDEGGRLRSFQAAVGVGSVRAEFPNYYGDKCKKETIYPKCEDCGEYCRKEEPDCMEKRIDIRHYFDAAKKLTKTSVDEVPLMKGVRGTSNKDHSCENLAKGLLRARHCLNVNKDGTIRYDLTEMPLTHFKPKEVGTRVERLVELGYGKDIYGKSLESDEQLLELFPQDVILPACPETQDERADDVFINIANFIDELLVKVYGLEPFYKISSREDIVGHLILGLAPHTSAAIVGRIIGFSRTQGGLAHPMWHAAQRRDCEGDETCIILLLDGLINFSRRYLPAHRGSTQDAPLVASSRLVAAEIDDMAFDIDVVWKYPLELYEAAEQEKNPSNVKVEKLGDRLGTEEAYYNFGFTHGVDDLNNSVRYSAYKLLPTMAEKVEGQMWLAEKLRSVITSDVARLVIERHFIRDTRGNLRKFSSQRFRCVGCNEKFRRPQLVGKCTKCGGKIIFTISEGSIMKYMQPALDLARRYNVSPYLLESLELTEMYIHSIFGREKEKQESIDKWF